MLWQGFTIFSQFSIAHLDLYSLSFTGFETFSLQISPEIVYTLFLLLSLLVVVVLVVVVVVNIIVVVVVVVAPAAVVLVY